ncbi:MAG: ribonuclease [Negativicutes bacterium]|jgi:ribonuclease T1|nr:ribonuclease [Negativicutes bacterium]
MKMARWLKLICAALLTVAFLVSLSGCQPKEVAPVAVSGAVKSDATAVQVEKGKPYSTANEVAAYIHKFRQLPPNFISKLEAQKLGWDQAKGNLWQVADRKSIGGDRFANREGKLPVASGRQYYECDIDYRGGFRGAKRLVYSNDGLVFYSEDHYKTFRQLY